MMMQKILVSAIAGACGLVLAACEADGTSSTARVYTQPPAYVLASLDTGQTMSDDDPRVSRYNTVLDEIQNKCSNTPQEISDVTIDVVMTLQRKGVKIDVYELMQRISDAMPPQAAGQQYDFNDIAAAFRVLSES